MKLATLTIDGTSIQLSERELKIIVTAMAFIVPSGGGSYELNLSLKLQELTGLDNDDALMRRYANNILQDSEDAGVIDGFKPFN